MREKKNWLGGGGMKLSMEHVVKVYLTTLELEGKSERTIGWYRQKLDAFQHYLSELNGQVLVRDLSLEAARNFVKTLMDQESFYKDHPTREEVHRSLSVQTIHGYVRSLRAFASWLEEEGYTDVNPLRRLKPPRLPEVLIQPLTEDEIRKILLAIPHNSSEGVRNYAIVLMFLDTGIRLSELANLKLADIDYGLGQFKVFGKGSRERLVPIGHTAQRSVINYVDGKRPDPVNPREELVFLTVAGDPMSRNSIGKVVQRLARRSKVERLHPHLFRHTFAVRYLMNGGDVFSLQKILGHRSLEMTRRYVQLAGAEIKDKHRLFSPVDNLGIASRRMGRPKPRM